MGGARPNRRPIDPKGTSVTAFSNVHGAGRRRARPLIAWMLLALLATIGIAPIRLASARQATPVATPDPEVVALLDYDATAPLDLKEIGVEERDGAAIHDVTFASPGRTVEAYLVEPAGTAATPAAEASHAGIVFFHWLETGNPTSNRTEFLDDAVTLAGQGVVSVLVQGVFPWTEDPQNLEHDQQAIVSEILVARRAFDLLESRPDVDPSRLAFVGHDYGAMYGSALAAVDRRAKAYVLMAATPRHADWNIPFWLAPSGLDEAGQAAYQVALAPLDPITNVQYAAPAAILFQFGREDPYIPEATALEFYLAASEPKRLELFDADHPLNADATTARLAWLAGQLNLP